jgi:hypothetical protein
MITGSVSSLLSRRGILTSLLRASLVKIRGYVTYEVLYTFKMTRLLFSAMVLPPYVRCHTPFQAPHDLRLLKQVLNKHIAHRHYPPNPKPQPYQR